VDEATRLGIETLHSRGFWEDALPVIDVFAELGVDRDGLIRATALNILHPRALIYLVKPEERWRFDSPERSST
jgi:hypothetical protein